MRQRLSIALHAVSVRRGKTWALREVTWRLRPGERWALLGGNGAGKTQLLKLLSGAVWPTPGSAYSERIEPVTGGFDGRSYRRGGKLLSLLEAKAHIAYVGGEMQDAYARHGWNPTVRDLIATGIHGTDLLLSPISPPQAARIARMLRLCRLQILARRAFSTLSYGEKRLALLARALVQNPDWLLLDEFYNGLDGVYRGHIDEALQIAQRRGQSWVASAHRAADIPRGTRQVLALAHGRVLYRKPLQRDAPEFATRAADPEPDQPRAPRRRLGPVLIELHDVDLYVEYRAVLEQVNWQLLRGQHWIISGANGAGKSSFLRLLYGDLAPALGGGIERAGCPPGTPISEWKRRVGMVSPELQTTYLVDASVLEVVASGRHSSIGLADSMTRAEERAARYWLDFFELQNFAHHRPRELSYGQMRRALIARAMAAEVSILLLDEPLTGLDASHRAAVKRLLQSLMHRVSLIAAVHHSEDLPRGMTHTLHLHNRRAHSSRLKTAT